MITYYELWDLTTRNMIGEWTSYKDPLNKILRDVKAYLVDNYRYVYAIIIFDYKDKDSSEYKFHTTWHNIKWFIKCMEELKDSGVIL